jgi:hypothetical protein
MEGCIREICTQVGWSFDKMIQQYNSNTMTESHSINCIIDYKIENNKDVIYKEDIPKIYSKYFEPNTSQEDLMENVIKYIKNHNFDINNLKVKHCYTHRMLFYYMSTLLEHEPVDIKIALKD